MSTAQHTTEPAQGIATYTCDRDQIDSAFDALDLERFIRELPFGIDNTEEAIVRTANALRNLIADIDLIEIAVPLDEMRTKCLRVFREHDMVEWSTRVSPAFKPGRWSVAQRDHRVREGDGFWEPVVALYELPDASGGASITLRQSRQREATPVLLFELMHSLRPLLSRVMLSIVSRLQRRDTTASTMQRAAASMCAGSYRL